ncbi:hypothetical protein MTO96_014379 [Rhipicephalus appendiculatus]
MVEPYVGGALHPAAWDWPPGAPLCCAAYSPRCFIIQKVRSQTRSLGAAPAAGEPRYQMVRQRRPPADVDGVETRSPRCAPRTTIVIASEESPCAGTFHPPPPSDLTVPFPASLSPSGASP